MPSTPKTSLLHRCWPWLKRLAFGLFFIAAGSLLVRQVRGTDWGAVLQALQGYPLAVLVLAAALAAASFALYSCFDLLGRRYTGHTLATPTVMAVTAVSYVFNLNLGSLVGGIGFRYRLYSRLGLATGVITRILSLSLVTNWMGYLLVGGLVFCTMPPPLPEHWAISAVHLRVIGAVLLGMAAVYLALCAFSARREFAIRGHPLALPSAPMAGLQLVMGAANWLLMSGVIFVLLQQRVAFGTVVSVLLLAGVAGVVTHIPAGLGVLEAVFTVLLSQQLPPPVIVAALVAYRVIYYAAPLAVATVAYAVMEGRASTRSMPAELQRDSI